jgi:hypothetical protein
MQTFNVEKVRQIAIDKPHRKQIYVADNQNRSHVIDLLLSMGYETDMSYLIEKPNYYPIIIDTKSKYFLPIPTGIFACALQSGAKQLNYKELVKLF